MEEQMNRRDFVRMSLRTALMATTLSGVPLLEIGPGIANAATPPQVAVRRGKDIPTLVRQAVDALGGISRYVRPDETVVVKPNIGWDRSMEFAATTHPLVVRTVVELCLEAGARKVLVLDNSANDPRRCYVNSGIKPEVEKLGAKQVSVEYMNPRGYRELDIKGGAGLNRWSFYRPVIDADRLINLPIAKHHSFCVLTLGMKNMMGVIGGNRGVLHKNISDCLVDINSVMPSDLTIVDATRILLRNGPQGGRLEDVKVMDTLIASPDIVAADSYAATLFGFQPQDIPAIVAGGKRGLGQMDLTKLNMV